MATIVSLQELETFLRKENRGRVVLAGGCFDILHIGHVRFLSEAKKMGDYLVVLLESDQKVRKLNGKNRPIFDQEVRAEMLSTLACVDLVVLLPMMEYDGDYLSLVMKIKPNIIAVTENDARIEKKRHQAETVGGELRVIPSVKTLSTSALAKIIGVD
jgi:FAD synthetase